jgi:hypothetical protein
MGKLKMPEKGKSAAMMAELQAEHAAADEVPEPEIETLQPANATSLQAYKLTNLQASKASPAAAEDAAPADQGHALSPTPQSRDERLQTALQRAAADEMAVVTVRVSAALNRYLDAYVARMQLVDPTHRYRKQDAIAEAFAAFYADHPMPPLPDEGGL